MPVRCSRLTYVWMHLGCDGSSSGVRHHDTRQGCRWSQRAGPNGSPLGAHRRHRQGPLRPRHPAVDEVTSLGITTVAAGHSAALHGERLAEAFRLIRTLPSLPPRPCSASTTWTRSSAPTSSAPTETDRPTMRTSTKHRFTAFAIAAAATTALPVTAWGTGNDTTTPSRLESDCRQFRRWQAHSP